ncbi:MAG: TonB-dependent siderophore receptor [Bacteroidales bacterium]|nr:TonB-dependent siderophore receptor [Bacteroidales bacterium]
MKRFTLLLLVILCAMTMNAQVNQSLSDTITVNEVEVTAKYVAPVSVSGMTIPVRQVPQSVSIVNPVRIKELNINTLDEAMHQVTGVTTIANDYMRSHYRSRGYYMSIMTDGLPSYSALQLSQQFDLAIFDQVEVLRGVSGILQGVPDGQSLGGVINLVRKRAHRDFSFNATVSAGTWNNYRTEFDLNVPLTKDGKLRSRWVAFMNTRNFFYDRSALNKGGAYGVIEWDATKTTFISLSYAYQKAHGDVLYNGLPALREDSSDPHRYHLNVSRNFNPTPDWDYTNWETQEALLKVEQKISDNWNVTAKASYKIQGQENKYALAGTVSNADTTSNYLLGYQDEKLPHFVGAVDFNGKFRLFGQTQHLVVGANYENFIDDKSTISGYNKVKFGNPFLVPNFEIPYSSLDHSKMRVRQYGAYTQLHLALLRNLKVHLGGRLSTVTASMYNFNDNAWVEAISEKFRFTPYAAITYDPVEAMTLYASYTSIFVPQTVKGEDGNFIKPRKGFQVEGGLKTEFFDSHLQANLAGFFIRDDGRPYKVPETYDTYVNGGRVENKGVELDLDAYPVDGLEISAGYTYLKTKIVKSSDGDEGLAFSPVEPEHSARLSVVYRFRHGAVSGLSLGVNSTFASTTYASVYTPERKQDPYCLLNAFVSYDINSHISLYLTGNNLTDCVYYSRVGGNGDFWGDPRNFMFSARFHF